MISEPKEDLGVKIVPKEQAFWEGIKDTCGKSIENAEREIVIQKHVLKLTDEKIKEEIAKLK